MLRGAAMCRLPAAVVVTMTARESSQWAALRVHKMCREAGLPLFLSIKGAAVATSRLIAWNQAHPGMLASIQASQRRALPPLRHLAEDAW